MPPQDFSLHLSEAAASAAAPISLPTDPRMMGRTFILHAFALVICTLFRALSRSKIIPGHEVECLVNEAEQVAVGWLADI